MTSAHTLTTEDISRWKNLPTETHSFFQKYTWNQFLSDVYHYPDYTIAAESQNGDYSFLPQKLVNSQLFGNRLISEPFSDYAGPTATRLGNQKVLLQSAAELHRQLKTNFLEIRLSRNRSSKIYPELERLGFRLTREYRSFLIDLKEGEKKTWDRISSSTRRAITKSKHAGVVVHKAKSPEDIRNYHRLHLISSREHGAPAHPLKFFTEMQSRLGLEGQMKLMIATHNEHEIAGLLLLRHGSTVHYWQSCLQSKHRTLNPFHALLWKALLDSMEEGYQTFDLGRTRSETGVYRFKRTWGGNEYSLDHYCLFKGRASKLADPEDLKYKTVSALWKKIPKIVLDKVESRIIREIAL